MIILGERTIQAKRRGTPTNTKGVVSTAETTMTIRGALQPLSSRERDAIAPGFAERATYRLYSRDRLNPLQDFIFCDGEWCGVFGRQDWTEANILPHYEYIILKPEPTP